MAEPLQVAAKVGVFAGLVLLLGAGVFARWIALADSSAPRCTWLRCGALLGALLVWAGSALEVADAISRAAGAFDSSLVMPYMLDTRHGNAVLARLVLTAPLGVLSGAPGRAPIRDRSIFVALAAAVLATVSLVSHAGAGGRPLPVAADLVHLAGVASWAGGVIYAAWLLAWPRLGTGTNPAEASMRRLSTVGLGGLGSILVTGVYAAIVRLPDPAALTRTPYGRTLLIKVAAVSAIVIVAGFNRWVGIPWMTRGLTTAPLRRLVRAESLLILVVLGLTGLLVSQPLPEPPATVAGTLNFSDTLGPWTLHGVATGRGANGFSLELRVMDAHSEPAPPTMTVDLQATMLDMVMAPLAGQLPRVGPGLYRGSFQLPMAGQWQLAIHTRAGAVTVRIPTQPARVAPLEVRWNVAAPGLLAWLIGAGLAVTGLRRLGAGTGPTTWPLLFGAALLIAGTVAAVRAAG